MYMYNVPYIVLLVYYLLCQYYNLREFQILTITVHYLIFFYFSEFQTLASTTPYFVMPPDGVDDSEGHHLIVCVHGLDGMFLYSVDFC